ncbi:glucose 1-dehydrogenase [Bradyrhizobium sp. 186]|uniref:SDR family NAD(P)-dependent oxidoreductase n=1 Tax=Bradyrhizobium sp. 186 TaxID=2782654 RepID=UPI002001BD1D|nr:glucose 1-dehydrogenase [Bradyrhizobium sp. 186]
MQNENYELTQSASRSTRSQRGDEDSLRSPRRLVGKVAVVTGSTRGIGRAIAEAFLEEGAQVMFSARHEGEVFELINRAPNQAGFTVTDVTDPESVRALMRATWNRFHQIDILVSNAGVSCDDKVDKISAENWAAVLNTNLSGVLYCTQAVTPYMECKGGGRIINVSSSMGTRVAVGAAAYCASKAAVNMLTRVCAIELAEKGILVNCLAPGLIDEGLGKLLALKEKIWDIYKARISLRRLGNAREVAQSAIFLASDESSYVNGHILEVNGGLLWA